MGYHPGSESFAGCVERRHIESNEAWRALGESMQRSSEQIQQDNYRRQQLQYQQQQLFQQQQIINEMNRPRYCTGSRYGYSWSASCY
jgi:hypothetical protein